MNEKWLEKNVAAIFQNTNECFECAESKNEEFETKMTMIIIFRTEHLQTKTGLSFSHRNGKKHCEHSPNTFRLFSQTFSMRFFFAFALFSFGFFFLSFLSTFFPFPKTLFVCFGFSAVTSLSSSIFDAFFFVLTISYLVGFWLDKVVRSVGLCLSFHTHRKRNDKFC